MKNDEFENNFVIESNENIKETKTGLMRLNIAIAQKNKNDYRMLLNNWLSDSYPCQLIASRFYCRISDKSVIALYNIKVVIA